MRRGPHHIGTSGASDGDFLGYDPDTDEYAPMAPPGGSGITGLTSADASVTITDNGDGTLDLAAAGGGGGAATYHGCAASRSSSQSVTSAGVAIQFNDTDEWDTDSIHDPATNNTRFTIPSGLGGVWRFNVYTVWPTASTGRGVIWYKNGTSLGDKYRTYIASGSSSAYYASASVDLLLAAGDYVECVALPGASTSIALARLSCCYLGTP